MFDSASTTPSLSSLTPEQLALLREKYGTASYENPTAVTAPSAGMPGTTYDNPVAVTAASPGMPGTIEGDRDADALKESTAQKPLTGSATPQIASPGIASTGSQVGDAISGVPYGKNPTSNTVMDASGFALPAMVQRQSGGVGGGFRTINPRGF